MDRNLGFMPLTPSNITSCVCRMACDMHEWFVAIHLIWSMCRTLYLYNNEVQEPRDASCPHFGAFFFSPLPLLPASRVAM